MNDDPSLDVDGDEMAAVVAGLLDQVDDLATAEDDSAGQLAALSRQAELLEQAHTVLTGTLDKIDRV